MGNTTYVSLSLATSLQRSLDAAAHNLANASTAGFKAMYPLFESVDAEKTGTGDEAVSFVQDRGQYLDLAQGSITPTGNPLDLAITGEGWFAYEGPEGQPAYGRDGRLVLAADGRLTTAAGKAIMDAGGAPLVLPTDAGLNFAIAPDGTVTDQGGDVLGRVGLFQISQADQMMPVGGGLYVLPPEADPAVEATASVVSQGYVELSNVQAVVEMTRLMDIQQAYARAVKLMDEENDLTKQALQRLARTT